MDASSCWYKIIKYKNNDINNNSNEVLKDDIYNNSMNLWL